jgi:hypothetical protein
VRVEPYDTEELERERAQEACLREQGWNGVECKPCFTRRRCIAGGASQTVLGTCSYVGARIAQRHGGE